MQSNDLREELKARIDNSQQELARLQKERNDTEGKISLEETKLKVWRDALEIEAERWGEPSLPLFNKPNQPYRFVGLKLIEAVDLLRKEQPAITKKQIRQILEQNGFDFRGKRPGTAIHAVWVALERRKKRNK